MAKTQRHISVLNQKLKKDIDGILAKLRAPRTYRQVQNWLENFNADEVDLALNFLLFLDYITTEDLQSRLEPNLKELAKLVTNSDLLFIPYGEYVKSNDLIMYLINKSPTFKKFYNKKKFYYTRDILEINLTKSTTLVFVDDFIGSGKSFVKWYRSREMAKWLKTNSESITSQFVLCSEVMVDGGDYIKNLFSNINILGNIRNKVFDPNSSPFKITNQVREMESLALKYGANIPVALSYPATQVFCPRGYDNSESLLCFDYGTPNNTLPIIWGEKNWEPIFPRVGQQRIKMVESAKKDASQYLAILQKIGLTITEDLRVEVNKKPMLFRSQEEAGLLTFLLLKQQGFSEVNISQTVGVQIQILNKIIGLGKQKGLINENHDLTPKGEKFIIAIRAKAHKFRENDNLENKSKTLFVPSTFNNTT